MIVGDGAGASITACVPISRHGVAQLPDGPSTDRKLVATGVHNPCRSLTAFQKMLLATEVALCPLNADGP